MAYVAAKGGEEAIKHSRIEYFKFIKENKNIYLIDRVLSEGGLYSEKLVDKAIILAGGDSFCSSFYLRAQKTTYKRIGDSFPISILDFRVIRRISSTFKDIPGGQILGPTSDYVLKILNNDIFNLKENREEPLKYERLIDNEKLASAVDLIKNKGLILPLQVEEEKPFDITRTPPSPPYPRSAALQIMSRGETGGMLLLAYTSMRGYGDVHPTIGDLRIGYVGIYFKHPLTGKKVKLGEIRATSCEVVGTSKKDDEFFFTVGYGFCFGFNETKAIAMAVLDIAMSYPSYTLDSKSIVQNKELVLMHIDSIESLGFCNHYKLPHYVTFHSDLKVVERSKKDE